MSPLICECIKLHLEHLHGLKKQVTPVDPLGYPQRCCWFLSPKIASILICIVSLIWAFFELAITDRFVASFIDRDDDQFKAYKTAYQLICLSLLLAATFLALGMILQKCILLNIYIWLTFIYCILFIVYGVISVVYVRTSDKPSKRTYVKFILKILWTCIMIYNLRMVNSYKMTLWIHKRLDGLI